ncbi:MAG: protein kinase [Gammaproteobacteria bacterium]|nr:protein kinase [Gammaproteobacteria bacterium]
MSAAGLLSDEHLTSVGSYEVIRPIGRGAAGVVYLARNSVLGREVAIKFCDSTDLAGARADIGRKLVLNEAKIAGMLRHPNIVTVYDASVHDDKLYLVMEYVEHGRTLSRYCKSLGTLLPVAEAVRMVRACANALHYAHEQGVVHRDVKPRNILLGADLEPKISDFGLAVLTEPDATMTHIAGAGSPLYMSPEQVVEGDVTHRSDIFSLGSVLYELLTGRSPFAAENLNDILLNIVGKPHEPLRAIRSDLPRELSQIVNRALEKDSTRRYQSAFDMAADLDLVLDKITASSSALKKRQRFELVKNLRFFEGFTEREIREISDASTLERYRPNEAVVAEGDSATCFYLVVSGELGVKKSQNEFSKLIAGDCFGELGALTGQARSATVEAKAKSRVLSIPSAILETGTPTCQMRLKTYFLDLLAHRLTSTLKMVC